MTKCTVCGGYSYNAKTCPFCGGAMKALPELSPRFAPSEPSQSPRARANRGWRAGRAGGDD